MKRTQKKQQKKGSDLAPIQEIKIIDIFETINDREANQQTIISKLEELLPDHSTSILLNIARFYLQLVGLDQCVRWLKDKSLENVNLEELINKLEKLQLENQQNLVDEEQCQKIENNERLKEFFESLFSSQTDLPFECEKFFQFNYAWLTAISQTKFRNSRQAAIGLISIIVKSLLNFINNNGIIVIQLENQQFQREVIKFLNNLFEYLVTSRAKDVQLSIKKQTVHILFEGFLNENIPRDPYYNYLGQLFMSDNHECRELSIIELDQITKQLFESKKSFESLLEFLQLEQEAIMSLIFDPNESIQLRLIQYLKLISKIPKINYDFFKEKTQFAFIRIIFARNPRVRYECAQILFLFEKPIKSMKQLTEFYLMHAPFQQITFDECFNFITSFIQSHSFVTQPESYNQFFEPQQHEQFQVLGLYFYANILQYQFVQNKFWWLEETDQQCDYNDTFTNHFLTMKNTQLDLLDENIMLPFLSIYTHLNFKIVSANLVKNILISSQKIMQKSLNVEVINQLCKMLSNCQTQLNDLELIKDCINEMVKYLQKTYKEKMNQLVIQKIDCLIKYNLVGWKQILIPFNQLFDLKDDKAILTIGQILSSSLQNSLKTLLSNFKQQDHLMEQTYKEIKDHFYNYCLQILENKNKEQSHFPILQLLICNLIYTNNHKLTRLGYQINFPSQTYQLININMNDFLFKELLRQTRIPQEHKNNQKQRKSTLTLDTLPQLSTAQMELLNNSIKLINQCPSILINPDLGMEILASLLELVRFHDYFKEMQTTITSSIQQSISKVIENDSLMRREDFWNFLIGYGEYHYCPQSEELFNDFVRITLTAYLSSATKVNVLEKRMKFINHCAEMIQLGFQNQKNLFLFGLLNHIFFKSTKLLKVLQIDKLTYQKFHAFYESKSSEYHSSDRPEEEKKEVQKAEAAFRNRLKSQTGLSSKEIAKIVNKVGYKQSIQKDALDNKISKDGSEKKVQQVEEEEDEIPFTKQMKK